MKTTSFYWLVVLGAGQVLTLAAQPSGTFTATGDMNSRRIFHTATLLTGGRVLIAGGNMLEATAGPATTLSSAELYDPGTGTFGLTGNMITPRSYHTATLLGDGEVLIAGGVVSGAGGQDSVLASAELYDPITGTFSATGAMTAARYDAAATLLNNGKVLISGGFQGGVMLSSAELYDPSTGTFTATDNMTRPSADTATLLPNGKVLITRGNPQGPGPYLSSADLYDPSIGTFTSVGYMSVNHSGPTATLIMNGQVLIAGGDVGDGDGSSQVAELFNPATGAFSNTGELKAGREQHTATLLSDGSVLFAGGHNTPDLAASAEIYDPVQAAFSMTASMAAARELQTATLLADGRVLIAGGDDLRYGVPEGILSSAVLYTPTVLVPAPMLFSLSGNGQGQGAIWHAETGQIAASPNPTTSGDILSMYTTNLFKGGVIPPQVTISGHLAEVLFFGDAPGYPGYFQVNFRVPSRATGSSVAVRLAYLGRSSNGVTISVQ
jgi:hypothetical protein